MGENLIFEKENVEEGGVILHTNDMFIVPNELKLNDYSISVWFKTSKRSSIFPFSRTNFIHFLIGNFHTLFQGEDGLGGMIVIDPNCNFPYQQIFPRIFLDDGIGMFDEVTGDHVMLRDLKNSIDEKLEWNNLILLVKNAPKKK